MSPHISNQNHKGATNMNPRHLVTIGLLIASAPAVLPSAAAWHEGADLTIVDDSRTVCVPIESLAAAAGTCATGTLSGVIDTCWNDGNYNCRVKFTATLTLGPLVCAHMTSDAGDGPSGCWFPIAEPYETSGSRTFSNIPRDGLTSYEGGRALIQVAPLGAYPADDARWHPQYVFPRDPSLDSGGDECSSAGASVNAPSAELRVASDHLGVHERYVIAAPGEQSRGGYAAKAAFHTQDVCSEG